MEYYRCKQLLWFRHFVVYWQNVLIISIDIIEMLLYAIALKNYKFNCMGSPDLLHLFGVDIHLNKQT